MRVFPADSNSGNFQEQGCPFPKGVDWTLALTPTSSARTQAGPPGRCIVGAGLWLPSPCHLDLGLGMECPGCCRQGQIGGGALLSATLGPGHLSLFLPQQSVAAIGGSGGLVWTLWPKTGGGSGYPLGATCSQTIRSGVKHPPPSRLSTDHQLWDCRGARVRLPPSCLDTLRVRTEAVTLGGGHKPTLALEWIHVAFYSRRVGGRRGRSLRPTEPHPAASESHSPQDPPPPPHTHTKLPSLGALSWLTDLGQCLCWLTAGVWT